jgi:hypothetical protein
MKHMNCRPPSHKAKMCPAAKQMRRSFCVDLILDGLGPTETARIVGYRNYRSASKLRERGNAVR